MTVKMILLLLVCMSLTKINEANTISPSMSFTQSLGATPSMEVSPTISSMSEQIQPTSSVQMQSTTSLNFGYATKDDFRMKATYAAYAPAYQRPTLCTAYTTYTAYITYIAYAAYTTLQPLHLYFVNVRSVGCIACLQQFFKITFTLENAWDDKYSDPQERTTLDGVVIKALDDYFTGNDKYIETQVTEVNKTADSKIQVVCITYMKQENNATTYNATIEDLTLKMNLGMGGSLFVVPDTVEIVSMINGVWGEWIAGTCTDGKRKSTRTCIGPFNGGEACVGDATKTEDCTVSKGKSLIPVFSLSALMIVFATSLAIKM